MYENWLANLAVAAVTAVAVIASILVHYEGLLGLSRGLRVRGVEPPAVAASFTYLEMERFWRQD